MKRILSLNSGHLAICLFRRCIIAAAVIMAAGLHSACAQDNSGGRAKPALRVLQVWEMPAELKEISANVLIDKDNMACIQDNKGIIFIYSLLSKTITDRITFAADGDYESLALVGSTYYVCRADGKIFAVSVKPKGQPTVVTYVLPFNEKNDIESMFYDQTRNRLLIGVKEKDLTDPTGKGIYSFDLQSKKMDTKPVFMLYAEQTGQSSSPAKKGKSAKANVLKPSEIAIHPITGDLFVLNGPKSILVVADHTGKTKYAYDLDKKTFPQPEGLCFTPGGELYISSEAAKGGAAIIAKVKFD
jgi:uncharacterized protein YjiK